MMKTQIVYTLISSEKDYFLEELWVSLYSLRLFHPEATVNVLVDEPTRKYLYPKNTMPNKGHGSSKLLFAMS